MKSRRLHYGLKILLNASSTHFKHCILGENAQMQSTTQWKIRRIIQNELVNAKQSASIFVVDDSTIKIRVIVNDSPVHIIPNKSYFCLCNL